MGAWELGLMIGHFKEASVLKPIMHFPLIVNSERPEYSCIVRKRSFYALAD